MKLTEHFTLEELCASSTAKAKGIKNTPNDTEEAHLKELAVMLESIRKAYGKPIKINSGFRSAKLNKAVGGSATSSHCYGYAADIAPIPGDSMLFLQRAVIKWAKTADFDQVIFEKTSPLGIATWIHLGVRRGSNGTRRKQILYTPDAKNYYTCNASTPCMKV